MQEELHIFLIVKDAYSFCRTTTTTTTAKKSTNTQRDNGDSAWARTILDTNDCDNETDRSDLTVAIRNEWEPQIENDDNSNRNRSNETLSHIAIRIDIIIIRLVIRRAKIGWILMAAPPMRTYCDVTSAQTILLKRCMQIHAAAFSQSTRVAFFV